MMSRVMPVLDSIWQVVQMMAPYLLFGFAVAGILSVIVTPAWVKRHLGKRGVWQVIKAALLGVPLPLCSCGVLPLAFSLRRDGAGKGATVSFLASTPQTGVDSFLLTWSLLGPLFATARLVAAFVSGVVAGLLTDCVSREDVPIATGSKESGCCCESQSSDSSSAEGVYTLAVWQRALRHGFITLPRDMARPLLLGVLISGLITAWVPDGFFMGHLSAGFRSYLLALIIGMPLYICSASSVPLAVSFIHMGASPGAAMVFLITGPATNAASVMAMWRQIGRKGTVAYLTAIAGVAMFAGGLLDLAMSAVREQIPGLSASGGHAAHHAVVESGGIFGSFLAVVLLLVLVLPAWLERIQRGPKAIE